MKNLGTSYFIRQVHTVHEGQTDLLHTHIHTVMCLKNSKFGVRCTKKIISNWFPKNLLKKEPKKEQQISNLPKHLNQNIEMFLVKSKDELSCNPGRSDHISDSSADIFPLILLISTDCAV